jgi:hypothetical protein
MCAFLRNMDCGFLPGFFGMIAFTIHKIKYHYWVRKIEIDQGRFIGQHKSGG